MSAITGSTTIPTQLLGDWISQLSGSELKVMLYLTLRTDCFAGTKPDDLRLRQIAVDTNLTKKEVRSALRLLSINASFHQRFSASPYAATLPLTKTSSRQRA